MKILSLATVFPNPAEPGLGTFNAARLRALNAIEPLHVVAPIAPFDYDNPQRTGIGKRSVPRQRVDGGLQVFHPAWAYPPGNPAIKGRLLAMQLYPLLRHIRQTFRFDLIDAHFAHPEGDAARRLARAFGVPYVVTLHGNELQFAKSPSKRRTMQRAFNDAAAILAVSEQLRELALELGADPERTHAIGNGIDNAAYRLWSRPPERDGRTLRILAAGRLIPLKRFDRIIQALAELRRAGIDARLDIAGGPDRSLPDCRSALESAARACGVSSQVELLGWVAPKQLAQRMSEADLFCLASTREGWPCAVHEALACGCPVVATDVGDVRRIIPDDRSGLIVPVDDPSALHAALKQALQTTWDREAIAARAGQRTWQAVAAEVASVFRSSIGA